MSEKTEINVLPMDENERATHFMGGHCWCMPHKEVRKSDVIWTHKPKKEEDSEKWQEQKKK